jgi:hypothetical protein
MHVRKRLPAPRYAFPSAANSRRVEGLIADINRRTKLWILVQPEIESAGSNRAGRGHFSDRRTAVP